MAVTRDAAAVVGINLGKVHAFLRDAFPEDKGILNRERALIDKALTYHYGNSLSSSFHRKRFIETRREAIYKHVKTCLGMIKDFDGMLQRKEYGKLLGVLRKDGSGNMVVRREYALRLARAAFGDDKLLAASAVNFAGPYTSETLDDVGKNAVSMSAAQQIIKLLSGDNPGEVMDGLGLFRKDSMEGIRSMLRLVDGE